MSERSGFSSRARQPLLRSFRHALGGISYCISTQRNFRIHTVVSSLVVAAGLWLGLPPAEWAVLVLTMSLVFATEMVNTAVEALADALYPAHHPLIGASKDALAGAVLITAVGAVVVGVLVLGPRLLQVLGW
jgi:diacylglycerol kinase